MKKFGRNYSLSVQQQNGKVRVITLPFTIEFDITRNILSSANVASFRVMNLALETRNQIRKNVYNSGDPRFISLRAGYGDNLPVIFSGDLFQAWSVREGNTFVTQMESLDGGFAFANSVTSTPFQAGTPVGTVYKNLIDGLENYGVSPGAVGQYDQVLSRGNTYNGSTMQILNEHTGGATFIDNRKVNILRNNECLQGQVNTISPTMGLLGTPVLEETILHVPILFEPALVVGQKVFLDTVTEPVYRGYYKIISLKHRGTISSAVGGNATTEVGLFGGGQELSIVGDIF